MGTVLAFGDFELEPVGPTLLRNGKPVKAGGRALALLGALLKAGGRVVAKSELMDTTWPGRFVEEANLSVQISHLRRLLGRRADGGDWIVTVPGLGYRFAPDKTLPTARWDRPGIVVLPFDDVEDPHAGYFAAGIVTELIAALTRFHSFSVVSRSIAFTYRGRDVDSRQVARELGVRYVLEGSLRRSGDRLRITILLVDGISGEQIWAERFDGSLDDVFAVQDAIVEGVAVRVEPSVHSSELARSRRERPTSVTAYDIYLRAMADLSDESEPANCQAFALLQEAMVNDPDNPHILAQAAWALEHRHTMGWPALGADDVEYCLRLARRALQRANGDAVIMAQCGMALLQAGRDYHAGMAILRAAATANPNSLFAAAAVGVAEIHCGELDEAENQLSRVIAMSPLDPDTRFALCGLAMIHIIRGEYEPALARAGHALAINHHFDATYWMLVAANAQLGRQAEARRYLASLRQLVPNISLARIRAGQPAMIPGRIEPILHGLRLAGLEE